MPENTSAKVYEVILKGVVLSQETINRFFYAGDAQIVNTGAFLVDFHDTVVDALTPIMTVNSGFLEIVVQQVKGGVQFFSGTLTDVGGASGDSLPPFAAWDFTYVRAGALERNGYKRIAGVPEVYQNNGVAVAGVIAALGTAADALDASLTDGTTTYVPVIRRTRIARVAQNPPKYYDVSNVIYSKIGTQNSRKFGHGR